MSTSQSLSTEFTPRGGPAWWSSSIGEVLQIQDSLRAVLRAESDMILPNY